jgi:hypothetical protein
MNINTSNSECDDDSSDNLLLKHIKSRFACDLSSYPKTCPWRQATLACVCDIDQNKFIPDVDTENSLAFHLPTSNANHIYLTQTMGDYLRKIIHDFYDSHTREMELEDQHGKVTKTQIVHDVGLAPFPSSMFLWKDITNYQNRNNDDLYSSSDDTDEEEDELAPLPSPSLSDTSLENVPKCEQEEKVEQEENLE